MGAGHGIIYLVFSLEPGEKMLAPLFTKESPWRILDTLVGIIMWGIALPVLKGGFVF